MSAEYNAKFVNTDIATRAIHAGQEPDPTTGAVVLVLMIEDDQW